MNQEQKKKRLQALQNLKEVYEFMLQDLSKNEGNEKSIDEMLEIMFKLMNEIKELESELE
jgi:flagellin-specific chaperone FliS